MVGRLRTAHLRPKSVTTVPGYEFVYPRMEGSRNVIWKDSAAVHIAIRMVEFQHDELKDYIEMALRAANRAIKAQKIINFYHAETQICGLGFFNYKPSDNDTAVKKITEIGDNVREMLRKP